MRDFDDFERGEEGEAGSGWDAFDWQCYLKEADLRIFEFLKRYLKHRDEPKRLEALVACVRSSESETDTSGMPPLVDIAENLPESVPCTLHAHPIFLVTHGLFQYAFALLEHLASDTEAKVDASWVARFSRKLRDSELQAVLGLEAFDTGDSELATTHFKRALECLNKNLRQLMELKNNAVKIPRIFYEDTRRLLFDLRELWLCTLQECRQESRRRDKNQ